MVGRAWTRRFHFSATSPLRMRPFHLSSNLLSGSSLRPSTRASRCENKIDRLFHLLGVSKIASISVQLSLILERNGSLEDRALLGELLVPGRPIVHRWNLLIRASSQHGFWKDVVRLYALMKHTDCRPDEFAYPLMVKACVGVWDLNLMGSIHSASLKSGFQRHFFIQTSVVDGYCRFGLTQDARKVFDEMPMPDLVCWNALLCGYAGNGNFDMSLDAFKQILLTGFMPNVSTFVSLLPLCGELKNMIAGRCIHTFAVKIGLNGNEALLSTLIAMYGNSGDLEMCQQLFGGRVDNKDVVIWNSMMSAYAHNGYVGEVFALFRAMLLADVRPDLVTLVNVISSCGHLGSKCFSESLHAVGIKYGFVGETSVVTALVSMYAKIGDLDTAGCLFERMAGKNLLSWNAMISGYIQNARLIEALDSLQKMQLAGVKYDMVSMVNIVSICGRLEDLSSGKCVHAFSLRNGFNLHVNLANALLSMYADCGYISAATTIFRGIAVRNMVSWNALISGHVQNGGLVEARAVFRQMQFSDVRFDSVTLINILTACYDLENVHEAKSLHGLVIKVGYGSDVSLINGLITIYSKYGDLEASRVLFVNMTTKSLISWNALLTGYGTRGLFREAIELFIQMQLENIKPNSVTLLNILLMCQCHKDGKSIHAFAVRTGVISDASLLTSLICMYGRFGNITSASLVFEMSDKRNVVAWNAMISQCTHNGYSKAAAIGFRDMLRIRTRPDSMTILALLSACSQLGSLELGESISSCVIQLGFINDIHVGNSLIDMYARCGNLKASRTIFDGMHEKDLVSWSTMMAGYGMHGYGSTAATLFSEMKQKGIKPDSVMFVNILSACCHSCLIEEGKKYFNSMYVEYGIPPRAEHYACMVDLLSRAGRLQEAYDFVNGMPFEPSSGMLESLLGACRVHGNVGLGKSISDKILAFDPRNFRSRVLLSNIYAAEGKWLDADVLRVDMKKRGLAKKPGVSSIEASSSVVLS